MATLIFKRKHCSRDIFLQNPRATLNFERDYCPSEHFLRNPRATINSRRDFSPKHYFKSDSRATINLKRDYCPRDLFLRNPRAAINFERVFNAKIISILKLSWKGRFLVFDLRKKHWTTLKHTFQTIQSLQSIWNVISTRYFYPKWPKNDLKWPQMV